jgi:hypothetical protein
VKCPLVLACCLAAILTPAAAAARPLVKTSVSPAAVLFGDPVQATVVVTVDDRVYDPATITISAPTSPWTAQTHPTTTVVRAGSLVSQRSTTSFVCRTTACLPAKSSAVVALPPVKVTVRRRVGGRTVVRTAWPTVVVASRLAPGAASAANPSFELQTGPPPLDARVSSSLAAWLLDAGAILLAAGAIALVLVEVRRRRMRSAKDVTPLERALALLHDAEGRPVPDRRRALSLLQQVTPRPQADDVAADAAVAAWSPEEPTPEQLEQLSRRLEDHR